MGGRNAGEWDRGGLEVKMSNVRKVKDITGKVYERLTAIEPTNQRKNGGVVWKFVCNCKTENQNEVYTTIANVEQGHYKSCGCLKTEKLDELHKQKPQKTYPNATGYEGVSYRKKDNKYIATIYYNGKHYYLGYKNTAIEASEIRQQANKAKKDNYFLDWYMELKTNASNLIRARVTPSEKQKIESYAEEHNKDVVELIREFIQSLEVD
jgi:TATA-box binding protein (TBP) (component of TFIID and TFIIIB)